MDWLRGLRAGTAISTPLLLADLTGLTHLGWAALGGIEAIVSDAGGPYRIRLGRLSVLSLGGALGIFVGTLAGNDLRWALPVTLLFCFAWTYSTVLGQPFASVAVLVQVIFICGIGDPEPSIKEAALRAGFLLAGGAWATLLSLFLWPLDPYRPTRSAVAECYQALAAYLENTANTQSIEARSEDWHRANLTYKGRLRRLIEKAWDAVSNVRAQSSSETARGRYLIVLLETGDLILERAVALAEHAIVAADPAESSIEPGQVVPGPIEPEQPAPSSKHKPGPSSLSTSSVLDLASGARIVATMLLRRKPPTTQDVIALRDKLRQLSVASRDILASDHADGEFFAEQIADIASNLDTALETTMALRQGALSLVDAANGGAMQARVPARGSPGTIGFNFSWDRLVANWRTSSLSFRHAARVALVCGFDVCLIEQRHFGHGYWLMMTSLIVLQPHVSGTLQRGLQRVAGTVGGGILAALLAVALHTQLVTGIVLFPLAVLALALLPVNYAAYAFFLTPTFVLAFLRHPGDWQLAVLRIVNTIAGAAIAIAAMTVLFPAFERDRIGRFLSASLIADRLYLEKLMERWSAGISGPHAAAAAPDPALALARRATGLALNDMEESLERVLTERWAGNPTRKIPADDLLAFAAYLHRFSQTITALISIPGNWDWKQSADVQERLANIQTRMAELERQLDSSRSTSATEILANRVQSSTARQNSEPHNSEPHNSEPDSPEPDRKLSPNEHLADRLLVRLERQSQVMRRHLQSARRDTWFVAL